jgi:hypothetical protein
MMRTLRTIVGGTALVAMLSAAPLVAQAPPGAARAQDRGRGERRPEPRLDPARPGRGGIRPLRPQERRGAYQEPAFARGYDDGYRRGSGDGKDRDRYDPVGHRDYRSGEQGYSRDYGSRDAYRNNYRAGFRQGYDDGYREASRGRTDERPEKKKEE